MNRPEPGTPVWHAYGNTLLSSHDDREAAFQQHEKQTFCTELQQKINSNDPRLQQWLNQELLNATKEARTLEYRVVPLLRAGARVNARDSDGQTPLHHVSSTFEYGAPPIRYAKRRIRELLLKEGANPNIQDNCGNTAGHIAAHNGGGGIINLYRQHGLDISIKNKEGKTVMDSYKTGHMMLD